MAAVDTNRFAQHPFHLITTKETACKGLNSSDFLFSGKRADKSHYPSKSADFRIDHFIRNLHTVFFPIPFTWDFHFPDREMEIPPESDSGFFLRVQQRQPDSECRPFAFSG